MGIPRVTGKTVPCGYCESKGKVGSGYGDYARTMCPICLGRGRITVPLDAQRCRGCNGTGRHYAGYHKMGFEKHNDCHGTGWIARPSMNAGPRR